MFLTVTPNSALDRVVLIDRFTPGSVMRAARVVESVGGKGLDASVVLRHLGQETCALGFVAGETGKILVRLLDRYGIRHDLDWVNGETRTANVIVEAASQRHSHLIAPGYRVEPADWQSLLNRFSCRVAEAKWVIAGGSLPDGLPLDFYRTMIETAHRAGVPVLIDCPGEPARNALPASPEIMKMNDSEFQATFGIETPDLDLIREAGADVRHANNLPALVVTCGKQGILALTTEGNFLATAPEQQAVNAAGAGDAVSAGLVWRLSLGDGWQRALCWAAAAGAATVLTEGTADCELAQVEGIYPQVSVSRL
ncbi:MAG: hexose kinase [Chloroflexi bacterium]|nr:hexose kinase [Chloroflexota bacterium]